MEKEKSRGSWRKLGRIDRKAKQERRRGEGNRRRNRIYETHEIGMRSPEDRSGAGEAARMRIGMERERERR
jgi:hypothetical protein